MSVICEKCGQKTQTVYKCSNPSCPRKIKCNSTLKRGGIKLGCCAKEQENIGPGTKCPYCKSGHWEIYKK